MKIQASYSLIAVGSLLIAMLGNPCVFGQGAKAEYESLPIAAKFLEPSTDGIDRNDRAAISKWNEQRRNVITERRNRQSAVSELLKGKSSAVTATEMEEWFNDYIIPLMAQTDEKRLSELGSRRKELFRNYITDTDNVQLRSRVSGLIVPAMKNIVEGNYHPACRVNAMIILGRMNQREGVRGSRLPIPSPDMFNYLQNALTSDTLPSYLKPVAMSGIIRHASARGGKTSNPYSDTEVRQLGDQMVNVLDTDKVDGVDDDVVEWMQRQAIRVLGKIGKTGENGRYAKALRDVIFDDSARILKRMDAIEAYGLLDFQGVADPAEMLTVVEKIGELVATAASDEAEYIERKINEIKLTVRFLDGSAAKASKNVNRDVNVGMDADAPKDGDQVAKDGEFIEVLPIYQREIVKRRFKNYAWIGKVTLVGFEREGQLGLIDYVDEDTPAAKLIAALAGDIDQVMDGTDVKEPEVKDEEDEDDDDPKDEEEVEPRTMTYADELKLALVTGANNLQETLKLLGSKPPEGDSAAPDSPAENGSSASGQ